MATDFIMPRIPDQQTHSHGFYTTTPTNTFQSPSYPQISPLSTSTSNSHSTSPQSPKAHYGRQVRPLYMPAVLRPNEHPSRPTKADIAPLDSASASPVRTNSSYLSLAGLGALNRLRRRSTDENKKTMSEDTLAGWNLDLFPNVTDFPTRKHWKPDSESTICDEPTCKRSFSYFTRRHHCRRCGNIFCDLHSSQEIPLDQNAEYNPRAPARSRACNHCYSEYNAWRSRTNSQASSTASSEANLQMMLHSHSNGNGHHRSQSQVISGSISTPIAANPAALHVTNPIRSPDAAASVPTDWNWSTF